MATKWIEMTEIERERYRKFAGFTDQEREIFDLRARGKTIVEITIEKSLSAATVNRRIRSIKDKMSRT